MHKDIIYIDIDDDITAIIGKIKSSKDKIVALVPPKRIGVLQSAVNLKLLARTAEHSHKHLVIITTNKALIALSAAAMIPIARTLQSKPELAEIEEPEVDENEDVIDGALLPVGDLVKTVDSTQPDDVDGVIETIDMDNEVSRIPNSSGKSKNIGSKVPDFSKFRKKLFIGSLLGVILIVFLVWATVFAPSARIIVTTKTVPASFSIALKLGGIAATDVTKNIIQTVSKQIKKDISVEFDATGQKDLGEKAIGTIKITRTSVSNNPLLVPVGTAFTSKGCTFMNSTAVTLAATQVAADGFTQDSAILNVASVDPGEGCNFSARSYQPGISGIDAQGSDMTGGTTRMATVVSQDDIQKAGEKLVAQSTDSVKSQLASQFVNGEIVIADSFAIDRAAAISVPALNEEAKGKAKLTSATTFTMTAIAKTELQIYLRQEITKQIQDTKNQRIYDDGIDKVELSCTTIDQCATVNVAYKKGESGKIGPNISPDYIKDLAKGKRYGDVQALISAIKGVSNVDIKFSYFWVTNIPDDLKKIEIEFKLENA